MTLLKDTSRNEIDTPSLSNSGLSYELVPSRYALKIGEIDVLIISDGVLLLPGPMLGHNADPTVRTDWFTDKFLPSDALEWALNTVIVYSEDKTILIDAGMGSAFPELPKAGKTVKRLEAAGVTLGSITDVILTHLHMDHIGGLLIDGVKAALRPDIRIHVAAAEVDFWESPDFSQVSMPDGFPDALRETASLFLETYRDKLVTFENEAHVAPGVRVVQTGGHTPGHSIVRLKSGDERLTFAGDAIFQVGFEHPEWFNGFDHYPQEASDVRVRLLKELTTSKELLIATHLSFPSLCHVAVEGDAFRCIPGAWEY